MLLFVGKQFMVFLLTCCEKRKKHNSLISFYCTGAYVYCMGTILYINKERGLTETKSCPSYFSKTKEKWLVEWIFAKPSSWLIPLALECQSCFSLGQVLSVLFLLISEL